ADTVTGESRPERRRPHQMCRCAPGDASRIDDEHAARTGGGFEKKLRGRVQCYAAEKQRPRESRQGLGVIRQNRTLQAHGHKLSEDGLVESGGSIVRNALCASLNGGSRSAPSACG